MCVFLTSCILLYSLSYKGVRLEGGWAHFENLWCSEKRKKNINKGYSFVQRHLHGSAWKSSRRAIFAATCRYHSEKILFEPLPRARVIHEKTRYRLRVNMMTLPCHNVLCPSPSRPSTSGFKFRHNGSIYKCLNTAVTALTGWARSTSGGSCLSSSSGTHVYGPTRLAICA